MSAPTADAHTLPLFELHPLPAQATPSPATPDEIDSVCEQLRRLSLSPESADQVTAADLLKHARALLLELSPPF